MSGRPAGVGASVLGESHRPPSLKAGRSAALTYGEEKWHETHHCIIREPAQQSVGSPSTAASLSHICTAITS